MHLSPSGVNGSLYTRAEGGRGRWKDYGTVRARRKHLRLADLYSQMSQSKQKQPSPACRPHFNLAMLNDTWAWSDDVKFQRLYFYHARKAGGTSLARYFSKVAHHYGLEFNVDEWVREGGWKTLSFCTYCCIFLLT